MLANDVDEEGALVAVVFGSSAVAIVAVIPAVAVAVAGGSTTPRQRGIPGGKITGVSATLSRLSW